VSGAQEGDAPGARGPRLEIEFCTRCGFALRAGWLAQELIATFGARLGEVALVPGRGGVLEVRLAGERLYSLAEAGALPDPGALKRAVRDRLGAAIAIGHEGHGGG